MKLLLKNISAYASVICIISMFCILFFMQITLRCVNFFFLLTHSSQMAVGSYSRGIGDEKKFAFSDKKCLESFEALRGVLSFILS